MSAKMTSEKYTGLSHDENKHLQIALAKRKRRKKETLSYARDLLKEFAPFPFIKEIIRTY